MWISFHFESRAVFDFTWHVSAEFQRFEKLLSTAKAVERFLQEKLDFISSRNFGFVVYCIFILVFKKPNPENTNHDTHTLLTFTFREFPLKGWVGRDSLENFWQILSHPYCVSHPIFLVSLSLSRQTAGRRWHSPHLPWKSLLADFHHVHSFLCIHFSVSKLSTTHTWRSRKQQAKTSTSWNKRMRLRNTTISVCRCVCVCRLWSWK